MTTLPNNVIADELTTLHNLYLLQAKLGRIKANLALINAAPNAKVITVINGDLFSIAAKEYGDHTLWTQIAEANGLIDPFLEGINKLVIPKKAAQSSGGILNAK